MNVKPFSLEQWQHMADYVLPVLLAEQMHDTDGKNLHFWKAQEVGLLASHFPAGAWRDTYIATMDLIFANRPVHITTISEALAGKVTHAQLAQWFALYRAGSTLRGDVFDHNIAVLKDYGERSRVIARAEKLVADLQGGLDLDQVTSDAMSDFAYSGVTTIKGETAAAMADDFEAWLSVEPSKSMLTGVGILDSWIGGLGEGDLLSISAPMKQRKTSLLLNIMLALTRTHGLNVGLMMFEISKRMVTAQIVSMLAIEYLVNNRLYGRNIIGASDRVPVEHISSTDLYKLQGRFRRTWDKVRVDAVNYGIAEWHKIESRFRVYDRSKEGGSLSNCSSIRRLALRDKQLYGLDFMAIDHAQRINEPGSDYEKLIKIAPYVEELARTEKITTCLLAQLNVSNAEGTGNQHHTGVRGGTVLDEAVDYMVVTGYRQKINPKSDERHPSNKLLVGLQLSRYGDGGAHKRALVDIDPYTGLILNGGRGEVLTEVDLHD